MDKYALGTDIPIRWTLGEYTPAESVYFEIYTGAGRKRVTDFTITDGVLSWTFLGTDQSAYGVYGLHLVSGSQEYRLNEAFELIHGTPAQQVEAQILSSSVEIDAVEQEPTPVEETAPVQYESPSPLYIEKIPLGSNIILNWNLLTPQEFDFDLTECELSLYYSAAGSGMKAATDYELLTDNGYTLQWRFPGVDQIRYGLYTLFMDVYKDGALIAVLEREYAFELVHRSGSDILVDRIISFDSIVTTFGGGAMFSLYDVLNDGHSTVFRGDGETPAVEGDVLRFDGEKWHAIQAGNLDAVQSLSSDVAALCVDSEGLHTRVEDAEGNISTLEQTARGFDLRVSDVEGNVGDLQLTATSLTGRMTDAEGNIGSLELTATSLTTRITNAEGDVSVLQQTASSLTSAISNAEGDISVLQQTATGLETRVSNAEGDISTLEQTAESIQLQVDSQSGDIATLEVSARGLTSRVTNAEGDISVLDQRADSIELSVQGIDTELTRYEGVTDAALANMQDQIDGVIETWYFNGVPTLSTPPVMSSVAHPYSEPWLDGTETPEERAEILNNHIGDLYYDKDTGKAYRFMLDSSETPAVYKWVELADEDIAKALALAGEKKRVFVATPYAPYDVGDLWVRAKTVGSDSTNEIWRCKTSRAADASPAFLESEWESADNYGYVVNKSNLEVLSDAIVGQVGTYTYNSDGTLTSSAASTIAQTATSIRLATVVDNVALAGITIDATNQTGSVTIFSDNFYIKDGSYNKTALAITHDALGNSIIDVDSINVNGILSAPRILSSKIEMVDGSNNVTAGLSGIYDSTKLGNGIAAWYGGPMTDWKSLSAAERLTTPYAKSIFRMDGSGYLASGEIQWGTSGEIILHGTSIEAAEIDGDTTFTYDGQTFTVADLLVLKSLFTVEEYDTTNHKYRLKLAASTGGTGIDGFYVQGALWTDGDQIVGSGTPGGGGGGAGYLYELGDIYHDTDKTKVLRTDGTTPAAVGDVLQLTSLAGGNKWAAVPATDIGRVYSGGTGITIDENEISVTANTYVLRSGDKMSGYLIWTGNGAPSIRMAADTSNVKSYTWENTSGVSIARIAFHNTAKAIYINSTGASEVYSDAVGKYSLKVGENSLTYNTYSIYHSGNFTPGNYVLKAGDTMTGALYFQNGSTTDTYAPRISREADGFKILSAYTNSARVPFFIGWRNITTPALYLSADGYVGVNTNSPTHYLEVDGSTFLSTTTFGVTLDVHRHQSSGNSVVKFSNLSGTTYHLLGYIGIDSTGYPYFSSEGTSATQYALLHSNNYSSYALPLTGGTISAAGIYGLYLNNSASGATRSGLRFQVGGTTQGGLYVDTSHNLIFADESGARTVYHSGNSNKSDVSWVCSNLTANGYVTFYDSTSHNYRWNLNFNGTTGRLYAINDAGTAYNNILINNTITVTSGYNVGIGIASPGVKLDVGGATRSYYHYFYSTKSSASVGYIGCGSGASDNVYLSVNSGVNVLISPYGGNVGIGTDSPGYKLDVTGDIYCSSKIYVANTSNYLGISSSYLSINTVGNEITLSGTVDNMLYINYRKSANGHAPALFVWNAGTSTSYAQHRLGALDVRGGVTSTGDQVISSDERLKTIVKPVDMTVEQLAGMRAVIYDRKDSGVRSLGVIAQDWEKVLPESVNQGEYLTFKYAQTAMVSAIVLAKHETEQDKEIKKLREKVQKLEMDNLRLKARLGLS